ncbi:MAG: type II toxin-antitoxin system HicB family antitoxin [Cyclobacteriaceae bacterium]|nr:type II toxin-antitoxin system HicB family antitoxin [Cyclobacteriaceae bacterium]MCK5278038.1 type II toxin-antitoxin system HicB family antitoxin [Cyclobacteriaceae bacterium]MCK5369667.1 type II toxin-antitoxin system HicB family antitoxin [Cyclobacteriaceae bacterium]MCK5469147.1 type II toxin-antitoxin system HicB family antitoxin [Cyclobacteriaceae bacterium]MCK5700241.1 type II toxin-antitoxin system HicB family antitoxin [Cyclobacteriaceae bacterium]
MKDILKYKDFIGSVHFSTDDEVFHGKLIGIDDLVTFEGSSVVELKESFKEAVEDYLELCSNVNKSPNKSYKGTFNVRIKPVLHRKAARRSIEMGVSLNQFVELAIDEKLR